jgi:hypothetical protein
MPQFSFAWGSKGHQLVAEIAFHFLDDSTKQKVQQYLGKMSFDDAATWMDDNRSNSYYDYMKPWHYIDIEKGEEYKASPQKNLLTILNAAILQLEQKQSTLSNKEIRTDLLFIFHLTGDLHQPLHCGYPEDKGGNLIDISSADFSSNLHSAWDTEIIEDRNISFYDCLKYYDTYSEQDIQSIKKINLLQWMKQGRALLNTVYDYKNGFLDTNYINRSTIIIEKQLLIGGLRLASILTAVMKNYNIEATSVPIENIATEAKAAKTVTLNELPNYEGETIQVCTKILDGKSSKHSATVLNAGSDEQNEQLTILILEKDRNNFKAPPEIYYKDKSVCITGRVETYKGKPTITVKDERQIIIK